jgi:ABC-type transport system involved in multi-copper enzyme maturation permease subunit
MLCILAAGIFSAVAIVFGVLLSSGLTRPAEPIDFLVGGIPIAASPELGIEVPTFITFFSGAGFSFVGLITYLCAALLGGPSIAGEWEKKTGHMLFPKVDRLKLLLGRLVGHYISCAIIVSLFYSLVTVYTGITYGRVPLELLGSFGVAQLFGFAILCLVFFISSWMPNSTGATIFTIFFFTEGLMILTSVSGIFTTAEPLWSPSYLANLITYIMKMPETRSFSITIEGLTMTSWTTPTLPMGIIILGAFAAVSLVLSYYLFRRRQI